MSSRVVLSWLVGASLPTVVGINIPQDTRKCKSKIKLWEIGKSGPRGRSYKGLDQWELCRSTELLVNAIGLP